MSVVTFSNASTPPLSYTPAMTFGGAAVGMTFTNRTGIYIPLTKNLVWVKIDLILSAKGSSTGVVRITLPVTPASDGHDSLSVGYADALSSIAGHLGAIAISGSALIELTQSGTGTLADLTNANFTNTSRIMIGGIYSV